MSYVVLARKYRPQCFDDMVGQEHVGRTLGNAIRQDRVHHAYLFAGARGLGKTTTARIFAKGLVCEAGPTAEPCNNCEQCVAVNEGRSVDVLEIDGASNNSVENIRNLREQVHYLPQTARRKVYIIDEVHMLTTSAFNALLKTLEEPPPHVNFIFATTEPQKVLPTILSRVSRLDFRRISTEEGVAHLRSILERERLAVDDGGLRLIARASGGSVRDGLTLLDQVLAFADEPNAVTEDEVRKVLGQADRTAVADLVEAVIVRDPDRVVERLDGLVVGGLDLMVLSLQILEHLRDLTLACVCQGRAALGDITDSEYAQIKDRAAKGDPILYGQFFDRFSRVVDRLPTSRVPRLLLEMALLDLAHSEPLVPLGDLVDRLQQFAQGEDASPGSSGSAPPRSSTGARTPRSSGGNPPAGSRASQPANVEGSAGPGGSDPVLQASTAAPDPPAPLGPPSEPRPPAREPPPASPPVPSFEASPTPSPHVAAVHGVSPMGSPAISDADFGESALMEGLWKLAQGAVFAADVSKDPPPPASTSPSDASEPPGAGCPSSTCTDAPPRDDIIDLDQLPQFDAWVALVERIRKEDEYVSAVLSDVGLVSLSDGVLRVAAPLRSFAHNELHQRPEIRAQVEQATRDHFGRPFQLELEEGEAALPDRPSIALVETQRRENHLRTVEYEARQHTAIRSVLEVFRGQLTSTRPLQDVPP